MKLSLKPFAGSTFLVRIWTGKSITKFNFGWSWLRTPILTTSFSSAIFRWKFSQGGNKREKTIETTFQLELCRLRRLCLKSKWWFSSWLMLIIYKYHYFYHFYAKSNTNFISMKLWFWKQITKLEKVHLKNVSASRIFEDGSELEWRNVHIGALGVWVWVLTISFPTCTFWHYERLHV